MQHLTVQLLACIREATPDVLSLMADVSVLGSTPVSVSGDERKQVSAVIILGGGELAHLVAVRASEQTASAVVAAFLGEPEPVSPDSLKDGFGELANMVVGSAKAKLDLANVAMSCPELVTDAVHTIKMPDAAERSGIMVTTEHGDLLVDIGEFADEPQRANWSSAHSGAKERDARLAG